MLLIRRFEEKAGQLYGLGLIGGFCHLYIGQEAVAIGLQSALDNDKDSVITGYRDHGHMLAYGIDPKVIMAELTGRQAGISKGKGGSMHMFSTEHKFYGGHGIVGAQVSLGGGLALRAQVPRRRRRLPGLFRRRRGQPGPGLRDLQHGRAVEAADHVRDREQRVRDGHRGQAQLGRDRVLPPRHRFRIPGMDVNGMDVLEVRQAAEVALAHVRARQGPGAARAEHLPLSRPLDVRPGQVPHARGSAGGAREADPIEGAKARTAQAWASSEDKLKDIDKRIRAQVAEAADFAESSPEPEPAELYTDVLVGSY